MKKVLFLLFLVYCVFGNGDRALIIKKMKEEPRHALLIGNKGYEHFSTLKNPINDVNDLASILQEKGFEVKILTDSTQQKMEEAIDSFSKKLKKGGIGLFYYSGHGIQVDKRNYLIPVNVKFEEKRHMKYKAVSTSYLIDAMKEAKNRLNIVILDACRNDPFSRGGGGLAAIDSASGMYIAYSTAPGKVAADGMGRNGTFTKYLLKHMKEPYELDKVFKLVRKEVQDETKGIQIPWTSSSVTGDFYFSLPALDSHDLQSSLMPIISKQERENESHFYDLTFNVTPADAEITILNTEMDYYDTLHLKQGNYTFEVSRKGYETKKGTFYLNKDTVISFELDSVKNEEVAKKTASYPKNQDYLGSEMSLYANNEKIKKAEKYAKSAKDFYIAAKKAGSYDLETLYKEAGKFKNVISRGYKTGNKKLLQSGFKRYREVYAKIVRLEQKKRVSYRKTAQSKSLNNEEKNSIEKSCERVKKLKGNAAYYRCVNQMKNSLKTVTKPNFEGINAHKKERIINYCKGISRLKGSAEYYKCLQR